MTATMTEAQTIAWFIRPIMENGVRYFLAVAKDAATGRETIAKDRYNDMFRTEAKAREWIRATYHGGTSFPAIRTGSDQETWDRIRFGALYC